MILNENSRLLHSHCIFPAVPFRMPEHYTDSLITYLNRLSFTGKHDSVISIARPALYKALDSHDTLTAIYSGVFIAQSFLFLEDMDSVQYYTELISPMSSFPVSANLQTMLCNILGSYSLRTSLDYSRALNYYMDGLALTERSGDVNNRIALLSNIVNIFYIQEDPKGMEYADQAYNIAMNEKRQEIMPNVPGTSSWPRCFLWRTGMTRREAILKVPCSMQKQARRIHNTRIYIRCLPRYIWRAMTI